MAFPPTPLKPLYWLCRLCGNVLYYSDQPCKTCNPGYYKVTMDNEDENEYSCYECGEEDCVCCLDCYSFPCSCEDQCTDCEELVSDCMCDEEEEDVPDHCDFCDKPDDECDCYEECETCNLNRCECTCKLDSYVVDDPSHLPKLPHYGIIQFLGSRIEYTVYNTHAKEDWEKQVKRLASRGTNFSPVIAQVPKVNVQVTIG